MNCNDKIQELEAEIRRLRGASTQWGIIQRLLEESNRKLHETEEKLKTALEKAEEGTRAKSQFLANMSHEIRTPLNGIVGMAEILKGTPLNDEQREFLNIILSSSDALLQIINDILDFSKIEAGKIELESIKISLEEIISNVANLLITRAEKKGIELITFYDPHIPDSLTGDPVRIQQIILNLANNAIKFTHRGEVCISARLLEITGQVANIRIEIRDTGIGISKENQKKLFKSFSQADTSTTRKFGGTGLGLAISKKLVEQMGGSIGVESEKGKGSIFYFHLPLTIFGKDNEMAHQDETGSSKDILVLAVDDNLTNVKILNKYLEYGHYEHLVLYQPENVVDTMLKAKKTGTPFQVALLDYHMPGIDGIMLARMIKNEQELKDIKLILLSSLASKDIEEEDMKNLFAATLTKPVKFQTLIKAIEDVTGKTPPIKADKKLQFFQANIEPLNKRILVVDDNTINRKVAKTILLKFVTEVALATNGQEAVDMASKKHYDMIFMDMLMPVMDGITATKKIRQSNHGTVIIAMTANAMKDDIELCLASGMDGHISKPYKMEEIKRVVFDYLSHPDSNISINGK